LAIPLNGKPHFQSELPTWDIQPNGILREEIAPGGQDGVLVCHRTANRKLSRVPG